MDEYGYPPYLPPRKSLCQQIAAVLACFVALAFLGAMLYPVFAQARGGSSRNTCQSHLRYSMLGLLQYAQDYDGYMPRGNTWMTTTYPYTKNEDVYCCPTAVKEDKGAYGFAFHSILSGRCIDVAEDKESKTLKVEIVDPETLPILFDSHLLYKNASAPLLVGISIPGRHKGGNTIGYVDGHLKRILDTDIHMLRTKTQ